MSNQVHEHIKEKLRWAWNKIQQLDWRNPLPWMVMGCLIIIPFVAKVYVMSGLLLGLLMCISVIFLVNKSPNYVKHLIQSHPLLADLVLTVGITFTVGNIFGNGLILGIGAVFTGVLVSVSLPYIKPTYDKRAEATT